MRDNTKIKVGFCAAYDWELLRQSIPLIYKEADDIYISIDKNHRSWGGQGFEFDRIAFQQFIREVDPINKIKIYEDDFSKSELTPMENEVRQRNMLAMFMGINDGWHIQLDTDEYFVNFNSFVKYLKKIKTKRPVNICCPWIVLYKRIPEGFLVVDNNEFSNMEFVPIATNKPQYEYGRKNRYFNILTSHFIIHQSWARTEKEIYKKINNWGHKDDGDTDAHFQLWKSANINTYQNYANFHMIHPKTWPRLVLLPLREEESISCSVEKLTHITPEISKIELFITNSVWISRFNMLKNKFLKKSNA